MTGVAFSFQSSMKLHVNAAGLATPPCVPPALPAAEPRPAAAADVEDEEED